MKTISFKLYLAAIFTFFVMFISLSSFSQVKVDFENPGQFYGQVTKTGTQKLLNNQQLMSSKAKALPQSFVDTLKKYYWVELCSNHITENLYSTAFGENLHVNSTQINFTEYDKDGILIQYQLSKTLKDTTVYTTTFDKSTASKMVAVKNINKANYLIQEAYGEKENLHLVSFTDGILIIDISMNGRVGEKANFRIAYLGVGKQ